MEDNPKSGTAGEFRLMSKKKIVFSLLNIDAMGNNLCSFNAAAKRGCIRGVTTEIETATFERNVDNGMFPQNFFC